MSWSHLPSHWAHALDATEPEARRLMACAWRGEDIRAMKRPVRREVADRFEVPELPEVVERVTDSDGGLRYLFRLDDGAVVEAVRIPLQKPDRFTVCLSSQVGCAMRCSFCATGKLGLSRSLRAAEILGTFRVVRDEAPGRVTGAVFMGQGEPLHNYDEVLRAASVLSHPCGGRLSAKAISISTVGMVPQIRRYASEGHKFRLVVSLTSAVQERRNRLLPVAAKWSIEELGDALRALHSATGRRQTLAWVLLGGVNDGLDEVESLHAAFGDLPVRINLIDVNSPDHRRSSDEERNALFDALQVMNAPIVRRYSVGANNDSACGMLASRL